jgi:hypothetical protein
MDFAQGLASFLGLGLASGINLYAAVLTVGLAQRLGWITGVPAGLEILAHPAVLAAAGVMYIAEFVADKVPGFTPIWDGIHTFIRPVGGALLAFGATAKLDPMVQALAVIAGGSVALGAHATKMGTRLVAHAAPDPVTHSALSVAEDFGVVGLLLLAYNYPWIALPIAITALVGIALAIPYLVRILRFFLRTLTGRLASFHDPDPASEIPAWARPEGVPATLCFIRSGKSLGLLRRAYLARLGSGGVLRLQGALGRKEIHLRQIGEPTRGLFLDMIELTATDGARLSVYLTKDWSRVATSPSAPHSQTASA